MNQTLKNKCALVTGGCRGIGAAIVKRLASARSLFKLRARWHPFDFDVLFREGSS